MYPVIKISETEVPTYLLLMVLSGLIGGIFTYIRSKKGGFNTKDTLLIMLFGYFGMDLGSRALYAATVLPDMLKSGGIDFGNLFTGMVFYGGLLGSILFGYFYVKIMRLPFWEYADLFAPGMALCHAIGRIGCFLAGCCYGFDCDFSFAGLHFTHFPIQLVESFFLFGLFAYLCLSKPKNIGGIMKRYLFLYAVFRFFAEFFRGDEIRGKIIFVSISQWISVIIVLVILFTCRNVKNSYKSQNIHRKKT